MPPFDSGITRLTGYAPMLPIVIEEKGYTTVGRALRSIDRALYGVLAGRPEAASGDRLPAIERAIDTALTSVPKLF